MHTIQWKRPFSTAIHFVRKQTSRFTIASLIRKQPRLAIFARGVTELAATRQQEAHEFLFDTDTETFLRELRKSKQEVELARKQFNSIVEPMLVDHIIFRLGAAEKRFNYLFQLAEELGIEVGGPRWEWYEED